MDALGEVEADGEVVERWRPRNREEEGAGWRKRCEGGVGSYSYAYHRIGALMYTVLPHMLAYAHWVTSYAYTAYGSPRMLTCI